ncbi:putative uncharacterized protein [Roseburia sp. CAG:303]|nr:putative uncharacterized protein [Roseburia sp. CAG:303]
MKKKMNNKGFSLVELIVVIAIMAVLIGVLAPTLLGNIEKSRLAKDKDAIDVLYKAWQTTAVNPDYTVPAGDYEYTVSSDGKIDITTNFSTIKFENGNSGGDAQFVNDLKEYIGDSTIKLSSKYYLKSSPAAKVTIKITTGGKVALSVTCSDSKGAYTVNE